MSSRHSKGKKKYCFRQEMSSLLWKCLSFSVKMEFPFRSNLAQKNDSSVQWLELYHLLCEKLFGTMSSPQKAEQCPEET